MNTIDQQIEEQFGKIIKKFLILHHSWDGDGYGYVVDNVQEKNLILTNHSKPYEADSSELRKKIVEYQNIIGETNEALKLLD